MFPNVSNGDTQIVTKPIGKMVCSEKCEMEGVLLGLEMSVEYFSGSLSTTNRKLFVFCDCSTVIDKFQLFELQSYPDILYRLHSVLCQLHELEVSVNLLKIPGHLGIIGNDIADSKVEMHRTCPLQCSAEAEYFGAQAERVPKFGRTSAEYFFSTTNDE